MDNQLKQRLVGAAVIISLAVIFLPIVLDGGRYTEFDKIRIEIPQQPDVDFSSSIAPLAPPEARLPQSVDTGIHPDGETIEEQGLTPILDEKLKELIKPIEAPEEVVGKQGKDVRKAQAKKPVEKLQKSIETSKTLAKPEKSSKTAIIVKKEPIVLPLPKASVITAWVVQVGSFSSRESAIGLRDKIRKNGFSAFVESFDKNGKPSHRVRIGPETTRSRSDKTLVRLKKKMKLDGIVVSYP